MLSALSYLTISKGIFYGFRLVGSEFSSYVISVSEFFNLANFFLNRSFKPLLYFK